MHEFISVFLIDPRVVYDFKSLIYLLFYLFLKKVFNVWQQKSNHLFSFLGMKACQMWHLLQFSEMAQTLAAHVEYSVFFLWISFRTIICWFLFAPNVFSLFENVAIFC